MILRDTWLAQSSGEWGSRPQGCKFQSHVTLGVEINFKIKSLI